MDLIVARPEGLYCPPGDFYIDPWQPVERAVLTHAHGDHARPGSADYLATTSSQHLLQQRLPGASLQLLAYGAMLDMGGVRLSLHPAGHVLGSAQVRLEHGGEVWVVSGDYKLEPDPTCAAFEPLACRVFVTESTFGLPIYRWSPAPAVFEDMAGWWRRNAEEGRTSVLFAYALGKAQRILAGLAAQGAASTADAVGTADAAAIGPIICHGAVQNLVQAYRAGGVALPPTGTVDELADAAALKRALVIAPPSARGTSWLRRFGNYSDGYASGWMQLRGARRRLGVDRGFVLSDHADWPGLLQAIDASGAERVIVTHGYTAVLVRWLREQGLQAEAFETEYGDDEDEDAAAGDSGASPDGANRGANRGANNRANDEAGDAAPPADTPATGPA